MVQFGSGFFMPMDREYDNAPREEAQQPATGDVGLGIAEIGTSLALGPVPNIPALAAKLRAGIKKVELGFMGSGKGSGQGHTPEMYGKVQRQALREIQKANKVDFTTHATVGVYGVAGMDQQGNFSKASKEMSISEIKRAIDFAADVARGGPVVVHTGEFRRNISDAQWNQDGEFKNRFKMFEGEEDRATFRVIDSRTGGIIQEVRKNRKVSRPVWKTAVEGEEYKDFDGVTKKYQGGEKIYTNYFGDRVDIDKRVPLYDKENSKFVTQQLGWNDLQEEAKEMTARAREMWRDYRAGKVTPEEMEKSNWVRFKNAKSEKDIEVLPEEAYIISTLQTNAGNALGWAYYYSGNFDDNVNNLKKLRKAKEIYQEIQDSTKTQQEKELLLREVQSIMPEFIPGEQKMPVERIEKAIKQIENNMMQSREGASSQFAQAEETLETIRHVQSADTYAIQEAYESYAEAGIHAMMQTDKLRKYKQLKKGKPIAIAMENLFPETYGAHPDELIKLVKGGRKKMATMLEHRGMSRQEAEQKAQDHITATFDIGHLNMWRKYWRGDKNKSIEQNDKDFDRWVLTEVEKLAKEGVVGHLHLVDNYGYQDDHLAPGEGNAPIKEVVEIFKKHGYKGDVIVEPGADYTTDTTGFHSIMKTWKLFGSPVYGAASGARETQRGWGRVQHGYFGMNQPPYFTFGAYSPGEDWTLWSGVPLE